LIVPAQKVVVGASLMGWMKVVEMCRLNTETAGCVYLQTLQHSSQYRSKMKVLNWERLYLGDFEESPLYRGWWMQSSFNGTRVSDGYKIMGSVTVGEIFVETWRIR